jgi:ABC-2 type transport system ATP-binding protein
LARFDAIFGLKALLQRQARTLSLGEKMKCEITAAFLHNPELVFLDEPTIGLDIFSKAVILETLAEMRRQGNCTLILTSHDMADIETVCGRLVIIDGGVKLIDDSLAVVLALKQPGESLADVVRSLYSQRGSQP